MAIVKIKDLQRNSSNDANKPVEVDRLPSLQKTNITPHQEMALPTNPEVIKYLNMPAISISDFGADVITSVASYGSQVTSQLKMTSMPEFQKKVVDILSVAKGIKLPKDNEKQGFIDKWFNKAKYTREKLISEFSTVQEQIHNMLDLVDARQVTLVTANDDLDVLYNNNLEEYNKLTYYIGIGEEIVKYKKQELEALKSEAPTDMLQVHKINDMTALITRWGQRIDNLRRFQMAALQTAPTIRALQTNNFLLVDKFHDLKSHTIPSWEKQFALQINLQDQKAANNLASTIDDATNDFMLENSKLLCDTSTEIARANQRGSIYIETLEEVQKNLINMFDNIKQINDDGDKARDDAFERMEKMKRVYLQIAQEGKS